MFTNNAVNDSGTTSYILGHQGNGSAFVPLREATAMGMIDCAWPRSPLPAPLCCPDPLHACKTLPALSLSLSLSVCVSLSLFAPFSKMLPAAGGWLLFGS
eukprot:COSAG04_NODE_1507_length_6504_cov_1.860734_2_plen_100_part_00